MNSLDSLMKEPRCVGITYRDVAVAGEQYRPPLPVTGKHLIFFLNLGPIPDTNRACTLRIGLSQSPAGRI